MLWGVFARPRRGWAATSLAAVWARSFVKRYDPNVLKAGHHLRVMTGVGRSKPARVEVRVFLNIRNSFGENISTHRPSSRRCCSSHHHRVLLGTEVNSVLYSLELFPQVLKTFCSFPGGCLPHKIPELKEGL